MVLTCLDFIFLLDKQNREAIEFERTGWAQTLWLLQQSRKHLPKEIRKRIQMEFEINKTDPDFDFYKEAFGEEAKPLKPLGGHFTKHSSTG